jgi:putative flippase GtrA
MWLWLNNTPPGNAWPFWLRARPDDRRRRLASQAGRFLLIGVISTVAYVLLYLLLRTVMAAQAANAISLLATAVANTAANRRVTFGIRGRRHATRHQVRGLIAFGIGLGLTSGALIVLHTVVVQPSRAAELAVLVAANLAATVVRFGLYRQWVFRGRRDRSPGRDGSSPPGPEIREPAAVRLAACPGGDTR